MWHDVRALNATASALTALVVLACVASGLWWLSQRPMFTLRAVRVESMYGLDLQHVNELTVRNGVLGKISGNFFTSDLEQVRTTFEAVPWVRKASVRREWPNQLCLRPTWPRPTRTTHCLRSTVLPAARRKCSRASRNCAAGSRRSA
jgi:cell division protein FtsQ